MTSTNFFISPQDLWSLIGTADAPMIFDVCRRENLRRRPGSDSDRAVAASRKPTSNGYPACRPTGRSCSPAATGII